MRGERSPEKDVMHKQTRKCKLTGFKLKEEGPRPRNVEDLKLRRTEQPRSPKKQRQVVLLMVEPIVNKGTLPWQKRSQENASKCWPFCPSFSWWQMWCDQPCGLSPPYLLHPQALSQNKSSLLDAVFVKYFVAEMRTTNARTKEIMSVLLKATASEAVCYWWGYKIQYTSFIRISFEAIVSFPLVADKLVFFLLNTSDQW